MRLKNVSIEITSEFLLSFYNERKLLSKIIIFFFWESNYVADIVKSDSIKILILRKVKKVLLLLSSIITHRFWLHKVKNHKLTKNINKINENCHSVNKQCGSSLYNYFKMYPDTTPFMSVMIYWLSVFRFEKVIHSFW